MFGTLICCSAFGASLSYASSDPMYPASSPEVLSNKIIEDNIEVVIMSDKMCQGDDCGFTRPDGVAYRKLHTQFFVT